MFFGQQRDELSFAQTEAKLLLRDPTARPAVLSIDHFSTFCGQLGYSLRLIWQEKEIIFFAILQWAAIVAAYMLWTQMLDWMAAKVISTPPRIQSRCLRPIRRTRSASAWVTA